MPLVEERRRLLVGALVAAALVPRLAAAQATGLGPAGPRLSAPPTRRPTVTPHAQATPAPGDTASGTPTTTPTPLPDPMGRPVSTFGAPSVAALPPGKKVTFVSDGRYFRNRPDLVLDMRVAHLRAGRCASSPTPASFAARAVCGSMAGGGYPTAYRGIGFVREGSAKATPLPNEW